MWFINFVLLVAAFVTCVPLHDARTNPLLTSDDVTLTTGIPWRDAEGHVPIRREIRDLKNNFPEQWTLYILGLTAFQATEQDAPTSFYQIAGIHGRPHKLWAGVQGVPGKALGGYCPHTNKLFFPWHRPYLALYEQELYQHVRAAAMRFPSEIHGKYVEAAESFRIPYWDWALGDDGGDVPDSLLSPTVEIFGANGAAQTVPNPLHHFEFRPLIPGDFNGKWAARNTTIRWATTENSEAQSQNHIFQGVFKTSRRSFADSVSKAFSTSQSLNIFMDNIERVHGSVHGVIGGYSSSKTGPYEGHMWPVEYSAFEPLFMLHHCNVDRLFALYQAMNPNHTFERSNVGRNGNFVLADNSFVDGDTELKPFWDTPTGFWTPNKAKDTSTLGYAYPETQDWKYNSPDEFARAATNAITALYSSSARERLEVGIDGQGGELQSLVQGGIFKDWSVNITAIQAELPPTFVIKFSLAGPGTSEGFSEVGTWTVLMPEGHHAAESHTRRDEALEPALTGSVTLTSALLDRIAVGDLSNLHDVSVVPYLQQYLSWAVTSGDGSTLEDNQLHGLVIEVASTDVRIPEDPAAMLMYSGNTVVYPEATLGKAGGSATA